MIKHNQGGGANGLLISLILCVILLIASLGFGIWSYSKMLDYKNNVDAKISAAVTVAEASQKQTDANYYAQQEKSPLVTYYGPADYGSLVVNYPKTWSAYVDDTSGSNALVDGYFNPGHVPSIVNQNSTFALRVQVLNQAYSQTLQNYSSQEQQGQLVAQTYSLPKLPKIVGVELTGQIQSSGGSNINVTMIVLPLRADTLEIWTEGTQYLSDFNTYVLPNFSFSP